MKQGSRIKFCEYCLIVAKLGMQYIVLSRKQALGLVRINKKFKNNMEVRISCFHPILHFTYYAHEWLRHNLK